MESIENEKISEEICNNNLSVNESILSFPKCLIVENLDFQSIDNNNNNKENNRENIVKGDISGDTSKNVSNEIVIDIPENLSYKNKKSENEYNILTISGGSTKGFIALGLLQYLQDNFYLKNITIFRGTSIGAMICYLLIIGYTPIEIIRYICIHRIFENVPCLNFTGMMSGEGSIPYTDIQNNLEKLTIEKIGQFVNFSQLYNITGKKLFCPTFNVTQNKLEYLSIDTYPEMPCLTAIRMSCGLPILFSNFKYMGNYYIDGYLDNFPLPLPTNLLEGDRVLGINMLTQSEGFDIQGKHMGEYMYYLIFLPVSHNVQLRIDSIKNMEQFIMAKYDIIDIPHDNSLFNPFDLNLSCKIKLDLFSKGYYLGKKYYEE